MTDPSATYIAKEEAHTLNPAELYRIYTPGGTEYTYTSGDVSLTYGGKSYTPATIQRSGLRYDVDLKSSQMTLTISSDYGPLQDFILNWPVETIFVEVLRLFRDDLTEAQVIFFGQITKVNIKGKASDVECLGFEYYLKQRIPILKYQVQCNWKLFSDQCGVSQGSHTVNAAVTVSSDKLTLTSASFAAKADHYFTWGYLEWNNYRRLITYHKGSVIKLRYKISTLTTGETVTAYAGCDRSIQTCHSKFANHLNFGGFPHIPEKNPASKLPAPTAPEGGKK
jgi:uncharacterized phage protein (TIGR02218 family)